MDQRSPDQYQQARDQAAGRGADMPNWMLQRCVAHSVRLALTTRYTASISMHETAWGAADGFADEILRRRAGLSVRS